MDRRLALQTLLESVAGPRTRVYFQPQKNISLAYPCIVYRRDQTETLFAGNLPYKNTKRYQVTVIDRDPDSSIPDAVSKLPLCRFARHFTSENLNHDVYNLYF